MKWSLSAVMILATLASSTNVVRAQTGTITGTVTDGSDVSAPVPLSGVTVDLSSANTSRTATADSQGRYAFLALQPGNYIVRYSSYGLGDEARAVNLDADVRIDVCMAPRDLRGTLLSVDADITGVVRDHRTCDILANVMVGAQRQLLGGQSEGIYSTQTSSSGAYEFSQLDPGSYSVTFSLKDYQGIKVTVDVDAVGAAQPVHAYMLPEFALEEVVDVNGPAPPTETRLPWIDPVRPCPDCRPFPARSPGPHPRVGITFKNGSDKGARVPPPAGQAPPVTIWSNRPSR